ncbi:MAG: DUF697 domain-containing protein [Magnetococcales bacterium]|nr:DUF697 domain-containing protein [Magnetococcales bacterium]
MSNTAQADATTIDQEVPHIDDSPLSEAELRGRRGQANNLIKNFMIGSLSVGIVPVPLVDAAALSSLHLWMLQKLANLYGVPFKKDIGKSLLGSLVGSGAGITAAMGLRQLLRGLPVAGQLLTGVSVSIMSAASTYAVGKVFVQHFESGGTFLTMDPEKVRDYFQAEFAAGKAKASSMAKDFVG